MSWKLWVEAHLTVVILYFKQRFLELERQPLCSSPSSICDCGNSPQLLMMGFPCGWY